ncbi:MULTISPECIES: alanine/glycine:cation symporter family protein [Streptomyces]|uniref:Amino acid transport integral membrane protein n=1 Tax=Streptomyces griseus subsp. griseus (strain JCM 4626 / CBS 651.72 / NBRC 13350 / KCC S-0626 / ISP 5235) TaxID=455632 RepID=B1VQC8_STRGG|nr:alanine/glycine:cation symporter family protein [Streptomyces griseus]MBW3702852.1 alanine:cation symporter family protein [Streptomyces griseus]BAG17229.1 putative amino acid transport integral membrane protein [Streptomyces griseus subsp. griseus NBRC 13350]SED78462.1 alanine or glycine:cation symporter, AGCS family [Streptomyces griseus]SQA20993.1 amino acid transport integral membrane protein [Streptomyces griseus]
MSLESITENVDDAVSGFFEPIAKWLGEIVFYAVPVGGTDLPLIVAWLVVAGLVFTGWFGFVQLRKFRLAVDVVRGKYDDTDSAGEVNHFQALTAAVSGTVGLGNIAGVAVAVSIGGAGATFWMILCGLLGMATKFVEVTLGVKYREVHSDGTVSGGPMHYLPKGLAERFGKNGKAFGKVLAVLASIMILFFGLFGGNLFQVNQSYAQLVSVTGGEDGAMGSSAGALFFGILVAALVGIVLLGGIRSIASVTSRLIPAMAGIYIVACLVVILVNVTAVPAAIGTIIEGAFNPEGVAGGVLGALIIGFKRAAFSNEAGLGSAPIAHSAVKTKHPASEGLVALLEPFIDTVVICTMTALTIVIANPASWGEARTDESIGGVTITSDAFETVLPWFPYVLTVAVLLFAISTVLTWGYYGLKAWTYLFGRSTVSETVYKSLYTLFAVAGSLLTLQTLIDLADAVLFSLAVINIIGLYLLAPVVKRELNTFLAYVRERESTPAARDEDERLKTGH